MKNIIVMKKINRYLIVITAFIFISVAAFAQALLQTGGKKMPLSWIDKDTHHKVVRLTQRDGNSASFYFHNNPFITGLGKEGDRMVFYGNDVYKSDGVGMQLFTVNLSNYKITQLTDGKFQKKGEIVAKKEHKVYYQVNDSVFGTNIDTKKTSLVYVFSANFKANITTLNADESLLGGAWSTDAEKEISRANPAKHDYFNKIYDSRLPRTLFTVNVKTKVLTKIFTDSAWLNHIQFSLADPKLLMFC